MLNGEYFHMRRESAEVELELSGFNGGNWILICLIGPMTNNNKVQQEIDKFEVSGDLRGLSSVPETKGSSTLLYIERNDVKGDGNVQIFSNISKNGGISWGEVLCITPDRPRIKLPTQTVVKSRKSRFDQMCKRSESCPYQ